MITMAVMAVIFIMVVMAITFVMAIMAVIPVITIMTLGVLSLSLTIPNLVWFSRALFCDVCSQLQTAVVRGQSFVNRMSTCNMFL